MLFWNSLAFFMIQWMLAIWSLAPLPFLNLAWTLWVFDSCNVEDYLGEFGALLWASLIAQLLKNPPAMWKAQVQDLLEDDRVPTPVFLGFPCDSVGKESAWIEGGLASISGLGRSPGEGKGYSLQYSCLKNSMDCIVHGVTELDTTERLSLHFILASLHFL